MGNDFGEGLSQAIVNAKDPELVASAMPAYILMNESLVYKDPQNIQLKQSSAKLYAAYLGLFEHSPDSRKRLSAHAFDYSITVACDKSQNFCDLKKQKIATFLQNLERTQDDDIDWLFTLAMSWGQYIEANKDDWNAVAQLAHVKQLLLKIVEVDPGYEKGTPLVYLGILESLVPPSLGGNADKARKYFEDAINISGDSNLMPMVLYAEKYARMMFDRELHDKLIEKVLAQNPEVEGYTLSNYLAQEKAIKLKNTADEYF